MNFFLPTSVWLRLCRVGEWAEPSLPFKIASVAPEMPQQIPSSSPDRYRIPLRIAGKAAKRAFSAIPEDQLDRIRQARSGLLFRVALTVGFRYFRTVYDIPVSVSLEGRREGIAHRSTARRNFLSIRCDGQQRCESHGDRIPTQVRKAAGSRRSALREAALPTRMASTYRAAGRNRARLERFLREARPMLRPAQPAPLR